MTPRERTLALLLIATTALVAGGAVAYFLVWDPIQKNRAAEVNLQSEIAELEGKQKQQALKAKQLNVFRTHGLPADSTLAGREYNVALERLVETAIRAAEAGGVPRGEIKWSIQSKPVDNTARGVPEISRGKPIYTRLAYEVTVRKADMWVVRDVLQGYYDLGLLHQITQLSIRREDDSSKGAAGRRNDLTLQFTTEAIAVDGPANGPQNRRTLVPVPTAFAAAGGAALPRLLERDTKLGRGASARPPIPVLATSPRDYSLIALKDPFHGPLPVPAPFKLASIKDVRLAVDEKPAPVKVALSGEGASRATVTAAAAGTLFAPGKLKIDPKTLAIELPKVVSTDGAATVTVTATSAEGVVATTAFKVSQAFKVAPLKDVTIKPDEKPAPIKVAVSGEGSRGAKVTATSSGGLLPKGPLALDPKTMSIELPKATGTADATTTVSVVAVAADGKTRSEAKFTIAYENDPRDDVSGAILLTTMIPSSDGAFVAIQDRANRQSYEIKVEGKSVVVTKFYFIKDKKKEDSRDKGGLLDISDDTSKTRRKLKVVAVDADGLIVEDLKPARGGSDAPPAPKLYHWALGQSLADVKQLKPAEAEKVRKQAAESGPMLTAAAGG